MLDTLQDPRAYLQRRVALFCGVAAGLFGVLYVIDILSPSAEGESLFSSTRVASLSVTVTCGATWLYLRRGERPAWQARSLELFCMVVAMTVFSMLPLIPPIPGAGGVMGLFVVTPMALVVTLRAAVIPSPAWLSAAIVLVWGALMTYAAVAGFENIEVTLPGQLEHDMRILPAVNTGFATLGLAFVAAVISRVVHGLQTKVREAMQLGQYTLESKIGEGGMGAVYRARHAMLRRPTAVKLLPPSKSSEAAIARFEREVQQTSRLTHPNTVAIFDFGRTNDGVFYYAMEYLDGISLEALVDMNGALPADRTIHILRQVAEALHEAHGMGLVHRDIKPDNIVLCERGGIADVVKVVDFGLVKDVDAPADPNLSTVNVVQGTPLYMAPEALAHPDRVDARTDLYALGAVAYFLLTGEPVFSGSVVEVLGHHIHTAPPPLDERRPDPVDPALASIVMRCLAKKPDERFATAAQIVTALEACADANAWTRSRAADWWSQHRAAIATLRKPAESDPGRQTIVPA